MEDITQLKSDVAEMLSYIRTDSRTGRKGMYEMCVDLEKRVEELEKWKSEMMLKIGFVALVLTGVWSAILYFWKPAATWIIKHFAVQ